MPHPVTHLVAGALALAVALAVSSFTANRLIRRKLRLSIFLLGVYIAAHALFLLRPQLGPAPESDLFSIERLALAAALINLLVVSLINPLRHDRVPDRFPSIVQDAIVIGLLILVATFVLGDDKFLATGAVSAVVLGFALQDTLGNAVAGLAIQSEKPFNLGHWVKVGEFEGRVAEVTWRATKLRTKAGNFVIVPNSTVGKEAIINYSEPVGPTRIAVEVGVSYDASPTVVKRVLLDALANAPLVLPAPAPDVVFIGFGDFSINFRVRFWIDDYEFDEEAADQVRTAIYYAFRRHDIEIPYPIAYEIAKELEPPDESARAAEREGLIGGVDLLNSLDADARRLVASSTRKLVYGDGEAIVREGQPGESMYIVCSGRADVVLEGQREPLATIEAGGYFGEMSVLTGEPRTASVVSRGETVVLEIGADVFRRIADLNPHAVEQVGLAAAARRAQLEGVRAASQAAAVVEAPAGMLTRMRRFLRMRG